MGLLLCSCAEVHEPIELSFGMVSGMGPGIDVLDGSMCLKGNGLFLGFFGICAPTRLNGQNDVLIVQKCIRLMCEKLIIFAYGQYILGIYVSLAFQRCTQVQGRSWVFRTIGKKCNRCNTQAIQKWTFVAPLQRRRHYLTPWSWSS